MSLPPIALNLTYPDEKVMETYIAMAASMGIKRMSVDAVTLAKMTESPEFARQIRRSAEAHSISFFDAHAPMHRSTPWGILTPAAWNIPPESCCALCMRRQKPE